MGRQRHQERAMNILINGCSFMDNHYYKEQFGRLLNGTAVNIAKAGSSNRRIIRTTVEYIERNPVDIVVLGLTFYDRQESPLKPQHANPWVSYNSQGMQAQFASADDFDSTVEHKLVDDYVKSRYKFDINQHYVEQLYLDLKLLSSYLRERSIEFCIFNTCDRNHLNVNLGKGFIPFTFIGNEYLETNGSVCMQQDKRLPVNARHHYGEDVIILVKYLVDYINEL
jgi:hypothetical protein